MIDACTKGPEVWLPGKKTRKPGPVGETTVTLKETALADAGMPHRPVTWKSRWTLEIKGVVLRVSAIRQGGTVKKPSAAPGTSLVTETFLLLDECRASESVTVRVTV